jgi:hypothetical protein
MDTDQTHRCCQTCRQFLYLKNTDSRWFWDCVNHCPRPELTDGVSLWKKTYKKSAPNSVHFPESAMYDETLPRMAGISCQTCKGPREMYYMEEPDGRQIFVCTFCRSTIYQQG